MTARGTALLVALLATLAGYLWVVERRPAPAFPAEPAPLLAVPAAAVGRVELVEGERRLNPATPGDYGLGPGGPRLELAAADGRPLLALELGERNPAWTGLYARRTGEPAVLLVGGVLAWELEKLRQAAPGGNP